MKKGWLFLLLFSACALGLCLAPPPVLRLQVVGAGNSDEEQFVKLRVKRAVVGNFCPQWEIAESVSDAYRIAGTQTEEVERLAERILRQEGSDDTARAETGVFYFPRKSYDGKSYPAGWYRALRVTLGEGKGKNWWCMLYPPLCLEEDEGPYFYSWILRCLGKDLRWRGGEKLWIN